ncbi:hypothetical protein CEXT_281931 [Caerostris extrusa]|uniref:Uncharacterized protein n=1 Tax=Caerostris extrusa TaxID=172846 RepID=A0AAV4QHR5_CAEEX|nr:hypothetical protein CEXT_281931 [Caerostris extrusa]
MIWSECGGFDCLDRYLYVLPCPNLFVVAELTSHSLSPAYEWQLILGSDVVPRSSHSSGDRTGRFWVQMLLKNYNGGRWDDIPEPGDSQQSSCPWLNASRPC